MGYLRSVLFACLLLPLTANPAHAQQGNDPAFALPGTSARPATDPKRQGPELDVYRDGVPSPPPPTTAPVVIVPTVQPAAPRTTAPARTQPAPPATPPPVRPRPSARGIVETRPQPVGPKQADSALAQPVPEISARPLPTQAPLPTKQPAPSPRPAVTATPLWPWITAAAVILLAAVAFLLLRRPRPGSAHETPIAARPPAVRPAPVPAPAPAKLTASVTERPWLEIGMDVRTARLSLMGATVAYTLSLHNRGDAPAEDIMIRALVTNADAGQHGLIQRFFGGETGMPLHSVVSIAAGESQWLTGELRLDAADITPVQMGQRALLVPLLAFDAHYRWADEAAELTGSGRAVRAFIVGQEQDPPTERLSPFRLDLGPRQFRGATARATALSLSS